jgi:hypothetical protein
MKLKIRLLLVITFFNLCAYSQTNDSLIKFSDLKFKNDFEKDVLKSFFIADKKTQIINMFLTHYTKKENYGSAIAKEKIMECVTYLKKETEGLTQPKKIKIIYKYVHKLFFDVYKLKNSFSDIFEKGEYNCVSGSAMYAIVFELMDIPYQIVEAPQHVFLFAYPNSHKIMIETTIPTNGYFTFTDSYVEKFINYMYESKLISKEEYESNSMNQLFNTYYFATKGLSIKELAGIQYSNYASYYMDESEYGNALNEIKKAYFINPNERNKYFLQYILDYEISNRNYQNENDVNTLAILCRYNNINEKEVSDEKIKYEFGRLNQEQLITNSNYSAYTKSFNLIYNTLIDTTLKKDLAFVYHYELARLGYSAAKDKDYQLEHLKGAYAVHPKHADLQAMIKSYFAKLVEKSDDPLFIMNTINDFEKDFDFLNNDINFNSVKANCFLEMAYQKFTLKEAEKGETYLTNFESLCTLKKDIKPTERFVERAYSSAANYYYKKGNVTKTKQVLKTGISYAPNNFGLFMRLNQVH